MIKYPEINNHKIFVDLKSIKQFLEELSSGYFENRFTHLKENPNEELYQQFNHLADQIETFMRECLAATSNTEYDRLLDYRGLKGSFLEMSQRINEGINKQKELKNKLQQQAIIEYKLRSELDRLIQHLGQVFLVINQEGKIKHCWTKSAESLFGYELEGKIWIETLNLNETAKKSVAQWLELIFKNDINFDTIKAMGPFSTTTDKGFFLELEYYLMKENNIQELMVVATNKSDEKKLESTLKEKSTQARIAMAILNDPWTFRHFCDEADFLINKVIYHFSKKPYNVEILKRNLHSLKAGLNSFSLDDDAILIHDLENLLKNSHHVEISFWENKLNDLNKRIAHYRDVLPETDGIDILDILENRQSLLEVAKKLTINSDSDIENLNSWSHSFSHYRPYIKKLSHELSKNIKLNIVDRSLSCNLKPYRAFIASLTHVIRNSVIHGIETPKEREKKGKSTIGTITIELKRNNNNIFLTISDDGKGLDKNELIKKAKKIHYNYQSMNELLEIIFEPGFTTRDNVDLYSGRGIGLDAVSYECEKIGGSIEVVQNKNCGLQLNFTLPLFEDHFESNLVIGMQ